MARKLANTVIVGGVTYAAGSTPPAEVTEKITNPYAWADDGEATPSESERTSEPAKPARK